MIYLDHAASSPILPEVYEQMLPWLSPENAANPGSIHFKGRAAKDAIEKARNQLAELINCKPDEIYFTSGGTEANNLCINLLWDKNIAYSAGEHPSVAKSCAMYGKRSRVIGLEKDGSVKMDEIEKFLFHRKPYNLSVMYVNNETGTCNPIREIGRMCAEAKTLLHVDGVQAVGHTYIDVNKYYIDMMSISGHKIGAPQGVGAAYIARHVDKSMPLIFGGGQESNLRSGTENVAGIVALGAAAELASERLRNWRYVWGCGRDVFITVLKELMGNSFIINGGHYWSNIISLTIPGVNGEALCRMLDTKDIYISTRSACSSGSVTPSSTLIAMGLNRMDADCTVRISMGHNTTVHEMADAARAIAECVSVIKNSPMTL